MTPRRFFFFGLAVRRRLVFVGVVAVKNVAIFDVVAHFVVQIVVVIVITVAIRVAGILIDIRVISISVHVVGIVVKDFLVRVVIAEAAMLANIVHAVVSLAVLVRHIGVHGQTSGIIGEQTHGHVAMDDARLFVE